MANPRYNQPERQSGREKKLSELASLLQMSNASQGPALEQQALQQREQAARQNMMMQFMQMMQGQQQDKARQQQAAEGLTLNREDLAFRRGEAADNRNMANWQATDSSQRAWDALQSGQKATDMANWQATDQSQRAWEALQGANKDRDMTNWAAEDVSKRGWEGERIKAEDTKSRNTIAMAALLADVIGKTQDSSAQDALGTFIPAYGQARAKFLAAEEAKRAAATPKALRTKAGMQPQSTIPPDFWANVLSMGNYNTLKQLPRFFK